MSTPTDKSTETATAASHTRRTFLQRLALGSVTASAAIAGAAALQGARPADAAREQKEHRRSVKVFRLRSRKTVACRACQLHHRHFVFLTRKVARHHRAHPGCDCPITPQWIKRHTFKRLFASSGAMENGFVDLRKL